MFVKAGSSAIGYGAGVIGESAGQFKCGGFNGAGDQCTGEFDAIDCVVVTRPAQSLGGFAAVAVVAKAIKPARGGNQRPVFLIVGFVSPGAGIRHRLKVRICLDQRYVAVGRGPSKSGVDYCGHGLHKYFA